MNFGVSLYWGFGRGVCYWVGRGFVDEVYSDVADEIGLGFNWKFGGGFYL